MADLLHRLARELGIEAGSLGPKLLVSLLRDTRNALVQQVWRDLVQWQLRGGARGGHFQALLISLLA